MLSKFPGYTWHVSRHPSENIPVLTEELDERAFLFVSHSCPHDDVFCRIFGVKDNLLCILRSLDVEDMSNGESFRHVHKAGMPGWPERWQSDTLPGGPVGRRTRKDPGEEKTETRRLRLGEEAGYSRPSRSRVDKSTVELAL